MKPRHPQLALRLDFEAPDPGARWRDGAKLPYLGGEIVLSLSTDRRVAALEDGVLHLPLPPEATARQVQDGAEIRQLRPVAPARAGIGGLEIKP